MSLRERIDRIKPWAWCEQRVDPAEEHFTLYYRSSVDSWNENDVVPIARVGTPTGRVFRVEFLIKPGTENSSKTRDAATKELDFILVELHERDPWWYARYHCTTMANVCGNVHWSHFVPIPAVQSLLLPVLKMTADGKSVAEIRERLRETLHINPPDGQRKHKNGVSIFVNRVAWALAHLVTGKAITLKDRGRYQVTNHGLEILKSHSSELTIQDLH